MRIGIIAYSISGISGGHRLSLTVGEQLQRAGHEVVYACVYEDMKGLATKLGNIGDFKVFKPRKVVFGKRLMAYNTLTNHAIPIYEMCKKFKPDVVIETGGYITSLIVPLTLGIPSIHYCMYPVGEYSKEGLVLRLYFTPYKILEKMAAKKTSICTISKFITKLIRKKWDVESQVIYPPTDTDVFRPARRKKNIILCVIRYLDMYRLEDLIDSFEKLGRNAFNFYIIGGLDKNHTEYYNFLKQKTKNNGRIKLLYNADLKQLVKIYSEAKIFWFPVGSPFGIAIVEAQSSGNPVVTFGSESGPGEIVIDKKTGFHVNSLEEMVEKTRMLIDDENLLKKMSVAARKNAVERFGFKNFTEKFERAIEECL